MLVKFIVARHLLVFFNHRMVASNFVIVFKMKALSRLDSISPIDVAFPKLEGASLRVDVPARQTANGLERPFFGGRGIA